MQVHQFASSIPHPKQYDQRLILVNKIYRKSEADLFFKDHLLIICKKIIFTWAVEIGTAPGWSSKNCLSSRRSNAMQTSMLWEISQIFKKLNIEVRLILNKQESLISNHTQNKTNIFRNPKTVKGPWHLEDSNLSQKTSHVQKLYKMSSVYRSGLHPR